MTVKRLAASMIALLLGLGLSSCQSPEGHKTPRSENRLVGNNSEYSKKCQARLIEAKGQLLSGNDKKGFWLLQSLKYFALPKDQQEQYDILWKLWRRSSSDPSAEPYKNEGWKNYRIYRDVALNVLDINNKKIEQAQLELRLRNYQTAQSLFNGLLKTGGLTESETKFCQNCAKILETAVKESQIPQMEWPSAEQTQSTSMKKSTVDETMAEKTENKETKTK
ncbi:MAG: hypothetical protein P1V97_04520 [Planctomycetota bacterium]|nr:hypothetical protein [Planctomycetota bacterium]